jgi:glycosyltransferase involved in cell wall biosynthesis
MRWYYLGHALKPLGIEVEIVSSSNFHKYISPPSVKDPVKDEVVGDMLYHWIRTRPYRGRGFSQVRNQLEFVYGCYKAAAMLRDRRPAIVLASSPHPFVAYPAISIARSIGARFIYEVRDLWPQLLLELGSFGRRHPYIMALKAAEFRAVNNAEKIVSVKPGDFEYFKKEHGITQKTFAYWPNGFMPDNNMDEYVPSIEQLKAKYRILVGYVGGVSTYYRLENFVDLASRVKKRNGIGFVLVGKGDRLDAIKDCARKAGLTNFHAIGPIRKSAVPAAISHFDICYVGLADLDLHRYGISCNKIYEYMYAGKPILGSYSAGFDPIAASGCGFSVRPEKGEELADRLLELAESRQLRAECGELGKLYFDQHHDFRMVARKIAVELFSDDCHEEQKRAG